MDTQLKNILSSIKLDDKEASEKIAKEVLRIMTEYPGMTVKDALGISDEALEEIYSLAYTFYEQGKYRESIALFEMLAGASPATYKFVLGLAASYHQLQFYQNAAVGFFIAANLEPENPIPVYYVTDCFLKQELFEEALECAEITAEICSDRSEYTALKTRCEMIAQSIKDKK